MATFLPSSIDHHSSDSETSSDYETSSDTSFNKESFAETIREHETIEEQSKTIMQQYLECLQGDTAGSANARFHLIEYLILYLILHKIPIPEIKSHIIDAIIKGGEIDTVKLLHQNGYVWKEDVCTIAQEANQLEILQYFRDEGLKF